MTHSEIIKVMKIFFDKQACQKLNFSGCWELKKGYNEAIKAPGCTSCARRRARNKYSQQLKDKIRNLDFQEVTTPKNNQDEA